MKKQYTAFVVFAAVFFVFPAAAHLKGVAINLHAGMKKNDIDLALDQVQALGAKALLLRFCEYQEHATSNTIAPIATRSAPYSLIAQAVSGAKQRSFTVMLMPVVLLSAPKKASEWRGNLQPTDQKLWESNYLYTMLKYAKLAHENRADYVSIGSELSSMEYHVDFWQNLIRESRKIFSGKLFYSFNWDHLSTTAAWRSLDFLGVTAYFQLTKNDQWTQIHSVINSWAKLMDKKVMYTEVGYPSRKGALLDAWNHDKKNAIYDAQEQATGFTWFMESLPKDDWIHATILYEWIDNLAPSDTGYSPKGKPAQQLWHDWFRS